MGAGGRLDGYPRPHPLPQGGLNEPDNLLTRTRPAAECGWLAVLVQPGGLMARIGTWPLCRGFFLFASEWLQPPGCSDSLHGSPVQVLPDKDRGHGENV